MHPSIKIAAALNGKPYGGHIKSKIKKCYISHILFDLGPMTYYAILSLLMALLIIPNIYRHVIAFKFVKKMYYKLERNCTANVYQFVIIYYKCDL